MSVNVSGDRNARSPSNLETIAISAPEASINDAAQWRRPWKRSGGRSSLPAQERKRAGDIGRIKPSAVLHREHVPPGAPRILGGFRLLSLPWLPAQQCAHSGIRQRHPTQPCAGLGRRLLKDLAANTDPAAPHRDRLLDVIYGGQLFRTALRELGLTSNQVWGLTKTDDEWSGALEAALMATRRGDLQHGTRRLRAGCVCRDCREHQRIRMAKNR
jgi:hypothetical protein